MLLNIIYTLIWMPRQVLQRTKCILYTKTHGILTPHNLVLQDSSTAIAIYSYILYRAVYSYSCTTQGDMLIKYH